MEEEDNIIVKWAQEDVETSYNLLNNNNKNNNIYIINWNKERYISEMEAVMQYGVIHKSVEHSMREK